MITARIGSAMRRTARIACERPRATIWTLLAVSAAMFVIAVAGLAADHVDRWTRATRGGASMVVYLGESVDETTARALAGDLAKLPGVERSELVPASESAVRLQQALGADATLLEGVELASLPSSVEVTLAPGVRDVIAMSPTVRALRGSPGVDDIVVEDAGSERVAATLGTVRLVTWTAAGLLAGLALLVVLAAIRICLERGERELAVAKLLGASPLFVFVPTALAGAVHAAVAAGLAAAAVYIGIACYGDAIVTLLRGVFGPVELVPPSASMCAMFVVLGAGVGLVGGGLAGASRAAA
jgi:cell division transport system permease protein